MAELGKSTCNKCGSSQRYKGEAGLLFCKSCDEWLAPECFPDRPQGRRTMMEPVAWTWEEYFTEWGKDANGEYKHSTMWDDEKPADHPDIRDVTPLVRLSDAEARIAELEAALDEKEIASGLTSGGNLWRYWAAKAKDLAMKNSALERALKDRAEAAESDRDYWRLRATTAEADIREAEALLKEAGKALEPFVSSFDKAKTRYAARYHDHVEVGIENFNKMPDEWPMDTLVFNMGDFRAARAIHDKIGVKDE